MKKPLTPNAKRLRSNSTKAERYLWYVLRNKNPPHKGEGILDTGNQEQKVKAAFLICLIIFLFTPLYAGWQDNPKESIPLPHWTQEEHQRVMDLGGQNLKLTLYASSLSKKDVRSFYQNRLSNSGWQARDLAKEIKDLSAMKSALSGLDNLLKETLYFTKDNLMLSINFLPPRPNSNKTYFSVTLGQIKEAEGRRAGLNPPYGLDGIPPNAELLPSSISVYPGAAQSISSPSTSHQTYGYVTNDGIDKVASFYKFDMPSRFNWSLVKESPIEKNSLDFSKDSRDCPACAKLPEQVRQAMGQAKISFIALKFKRGRETCLIGITQSESSARIGSEAEQTRITIVLTQDEKTKF